MSAPRGIDAGVEMSFRIGQRVRHRDYKGERVTGVVMRLSVESERGLMVGIALDAPIVIPAGDGYRAINIHTQDAPAHEFSAFDERDELLAELLAALRDWFNDYAPTRKGGEDDELVRRSRAAIAKATGSQE